MLPNKPKPTILITALITLSLLTCSMNHKPMTPSVPSGPTEGKIDKVYTFSSRVIDFDGDDVAIRFDWGDGNISDWSPFVPSGETVLMGHSWSSPGTFYVKARAKDKQGAISGWSDGHQITISGGGGAGWTKTFGGSEWDVGYSVQQTSDSGYIIAGATANFGGGEGDVYIIKTDESGNLQWGRGFGGSHIDFGYSVQQTKDGGYIIVGETESLYVGRGKRDVYLIKIDANGNLVHERTFGGSSDDFGYSVQQTSDGGYIIAGAIDPLGDDHSNVYLIKVDGNCNFQWQTTFGGSERDVGYSVQQAEDGGYIIAGYTKSFGAGEEDVYLIKTDGSGNLQWQKTFGGSHYDYGHSVQQTSDGGYIIAGYTCFSGGASGDVYLIKTNANGNQQWERMFDGSDCLGYSVDQTTDGGYIITGWTFSWNTSQDVYLIKTDGNGNIMGSVRPPALGR